MQHSGHCMMTWCRPVFERNGTIPCTSCTLFDVAATSHKPVLCQLASLQSLPCGCDDAVRKKGAYCQVQFWSCMPFSTPVRQENTTAESHIKQTGGEVVLGMLKGVLRDAMRPWLHGAANMLLHAT